MFQKIHEFGKNPTKKKKKKLKHTATFFLPIGCAKNIHGQFLRYESACVVTLPNTKKSKHSIGIWEQFTCHPGKTDTTVPHSSPTYLTAGQIVSSYDHQLGWWPLNSTCWLKIHFCPQWLNKRTISFLFFFQTYPRIKFQFL